MEGTSERNNNYAPQGDEKFEEDRLYRLTLTGKKVYN